MRCKDCHLDMDGYGSDHHDNSISLIPEHEGRCCDCCDEFAFDMPAESRTRPRPDKQDKKR